MQRSQVSRNAFIGTGSDQRKCRGRQPLHGLGALPPLALVALGAVTGCELIVGIKDTTVTAVDSDAGVVNPGPEDSGVDGASKPGPSAMKALNECTLALQGTAGMRFGNLIASTERVDFCIKPSTEPSFAASKPLFASAGESCIWGLEYKAITRVLPVEAGSYDIRAIPAGSNTCEGSSIASLMQVRFEDRQSIAIYLAGDPQGSANLHYFKEARPGEVTQVRFRFFHAAPGLGPLDFGIAQQPKLPTTIFNVKAKSVGFGSMSKGASTDANGYSTMLTVDGYWGYAVGTAGSEDARLVFGRNGEPSGSYTAFATGLDTLEFPLQLWSCSEVANQGVLADCGSAPPRTLVVDTLNLQISGSFSRGVTERLPSILKAISKLDSDVACITNVYSHKEKQAVIDASKAQFKYVYSPDSTWATPVEDPRDLDGTVPVMPTEPPCTTSKAKLDGLVDCVRDFCSTKLGSEDAVSIQLPTECITEKCFHLAAPLISGTPEAQRCWICAVGQYLSYETMASIRDLCSTNPKASMWAFRQNTGLAMLSRLPLENASFRIFPQSFGWVHSVARASLRVDDETLVDYYCTEAQTIQHDCAFQPRHGEYWGGQNDCEAGTRREQTLHLKQLVAYVYDKSSKTRNRVIVSGDLNTGPAYGSTLAPVEPENFEIISKAFSLGFVPGKDPDCTDCADNPILTPPGVVVTGPNTRMRFHLMQFMPITDVRDSITTHKEPVVDVDWGNGSKRVPISQHYGLRSFIRIHP